MNDRAEARRQGLALRMSEDVNDFLLVLLIVNCARLNVHLASLIVDRCSCLFVDTIERL